MMTSNSDTIRIVVDYGYDIHEITLTRRLYDKILAGESLNIKGSGFHCEMVVEQDYWEFNKERPGSLHVTAEGAREIFNGSISDDEVMIDR